MYEFKMCTAFREKGVIITSAWRTRRRCVSSQNVWNILCPSGSARQITWSRSWLADQEPLSCSWPSLAGAQASCIVAGVGLKPLVCSLIRSGGRGLIRAASLAGSLELASAGWSMTMTAGEGKLQGPHTIPVEGEDVTPKKDGGVFKVHCLFGGFEPVG